MVLKFINIPDVTTATTATTTQISQENFIKQKFDYTFDGQLFKKMNDSNIPEIYNTVYEYYSKLDKKDRVITMSHNSSVSCATISAFNEKYLVRDTETSFTSDLKIIYIDSVPNVNTTDDNNYGDKVISTLLGLTRISMVNNKMLVSPTQIIYIGLNSKLMQDHHLDILNQMEIQFYTLDFIKKKGLGNILDAILHELPKDCPIHLNVDIRAFDRKIAPACATIDNVTDGLIFDDVKILNEKFKNRVHTMDLVGFDTSVVSGNINSKENFATRMTSEIFRLLIVGIFDVKEKKINLFTENSRFVIYRPAEQVDKFDVSWYILRCSLEQRDEILKSIKDDEIINTTIDDDDGNEIDVLVTATTIDDQNSKSYFFTTNIADCCLFPDEKVDMVFELINNK